MKTLLKFSSLTCNPCKQLDEVLKTTELGEITVHTVMVEEAPDKARRYGIRSVPTLVLLDDNGAELKRKTGFMQAYALQEFVGYPIEAPWEATW